MQFDRGERSVQEKTSFCPVCGAVCPTEFAVAEGGEILSVQPAAERAAGERDAGRGSVCRQRQLFLEQRFQPRNRLNKPLIWRDQRYQEADWTKVLDHLATQLRVCGPWETAVLADTRLTSEELFLLQKFARTVLQTNLVGCITPPGQAAAAELLKRTARPPEGLQGSLQELSTAACVLALGVDPGADRPFTELIARETVRGGAKLLVANPKSLESGRHAAINLSHHPGAEVVLISGLIHLLLETHAVDASFAEKHSSLIHRLRKQLAGYGPVQVAKKTGVRPGDLLAAASLLGEKGSRPLTVVCGPYLMQSGTAQETLKAVMTLLHLTGSVGRVGGGIIPLYGGGNFRGALDLGMISQLFGLPGSTGDDSNVPADNIREMFASAGIKAVYLALNSCDGRLVDFLRPFLQEVNLVILHDVLPTALLLEGGGAPPAQVVLPMATVLEKGGMFSDIDGREVHLPAVVPAPGESRSSVWVIEELARRMRVPGFAYPEKELLRQEIRKQVAANGAALQRSPRGSTCCAKGSESAAAKSPSNRPEFFPDWSPAPIEVY